MITWVRFSDANGLRWPYLTNSTYEFDVNQRKVYRPIPGDTYPIGLFVQGRSLPPAGAVRDPRAPVRPARPGIHRPGRPQPAHALSASAPTTSGADVLSRLLYGGRISLSVGLIGVAITFVLGMLGGRRLRLLRRAHRHRHPAPCAKCSC